MLETESTQQTLPGTPPYVFLKRSCDVPSAINQKPDMPRYLVTMYKGIGDAVAVGLSAIDQIVRNDPGASGTIDVLCTRIQAELFEHDPRVNRIVLADKSLFPSPEIIMWLKGITLDTKTAELVHFLQKRSYTAIFPGMFAPGFYLRLHASMMNPNFIEMGKTFIALRKRVDRPMSYVVRGMVNRYFGKSLQTSSQVAGNIPLYISSEEIRHANAVVQTMKECSGVPVESARLLVVASDTASVVTRPPVTLLATALADALERCPDLVVCILQGLTEAQSGEDLLHVLRGAFNDRVFMVSGEPRAGLLDVAAFIDQADVFVTGDTGLMHIAATSKRLPGGDRAHCLPKNSVKIIALFGGTNPHLYGYPQQTTILGAGREEQATFVPGILKESYDPQGRDLFNHISPQQLTEAIISLQQPDSGACRRHVPL